MTFPPSRARTPRLSDKVRREVAADLEVSITTIRAMCYLAVLVAQIPLNLAKHFPYWIHAASVVIAFGMTAWIPFFLFRKKGKLWNYQAILATLSDLILVLVLTLGFTYAGMHGKATPLAGLMGNLTLLIMLNGLRLNRGLRHLAGVLALLELLIYQLLFPGNSQMILFVWIFFAWLASGAVERVVVKAAEREALGRFFPQAVAEMVARDPKGLDLGGKEMTATVMFTDLRGFTTLSETMEPEAVMNFINQVHEIQVRAVQDHGGIVNKFTGDGMLAIFGAPFALENDASKALTCALEILEGMEMLRKKDLPAHIGIGIHRGRIVAGNVGSDLQLEYTVIGDAVNVAARLESKTREFETPLLFSGETKSAFAEDVDSQSFGFVALKGRKEQVEVFSLKSLAPLR